MMMMMMRMFDANDSHDDDHDDVYDDDYGDDADDYDNMMMVNGYGYDDNVWKHLSIRTSDQSSH